MEASALLIGGGRMTRTNHSREVEGGRFSRVVFRAFGIFHSMHSINYEEATINEASTKHQRSKRRERGDERRETRIEG